jgi:hypothetical protein
MRSLLIVGVILLIIGIALLFVPIRHNVRHGVDAGPVSIHVDTVERDKVHPGVAAAIIIGGVALMIAGARNRA